MYNIYDYYYNNNNNNNKLNFKDTTLTQRNNRIDTFCTKKVKDVLVRLYH